MGDDAHVPHIRNKERCPIPERPRHVDANPSLAAGDLSAAHVAVIGINYAPEPTGSAPYTTGLAETLAEVAASVTVVCGIPHYPAWRPEPAYRWRWCSAYTRNGVDVHHLRHYVPPRQSAGHRLLWEGTFLAHAASHRLRRRPDIVIASTPSLSGAVAAGRLARRHGAALGVVVQDLVGQAVTGSGLSGGRRVAWLAGAVERSVLRQADRVAVVSDTFRPQLASYGVGDDAIVSLPNWTHIPPPTSPRSETRKHLGWSEDESVILHTGNMGLKQNLDNVVAAARLSPAGVRFVLVGDGSQRSALEAQARGVPNVQLLPPVTVNQYPDLLAAADVLLVNERASVAGMSLPSKLTSYLAAGRPVLAAVSAEGACARELRRTGGAAECVLPDDPPALAAAAVRLSDAPAIRQRMADRGREYARLELGAGVARQRCLAFASALLTAGDVTVPRQRLDGPVGGRRRPAGESASFHVSSQVSL